MDVAHEIVSHRPVEETLGALFPALRATSAERGVIATLKESRQLEPLAVAHPEGTPIPQVSLSVIARVIEEGCALILEDVKVIYTTGPRWYHRRFGSTFDSVRSPGPELSVPRCVLPR